MIIVLDDVAIFPVAQCGSDCVVDYFALEASHWNRLVCSLSLMESFEITIPACEDWDF